MTAAPARADDHAAAMAIHARRRAWERCGLALSEHDLARLAARCRGRRPVARSAPRHGGRPVFRLRWRGRAIWVVYDEPLETVVTVLTGPPQSLVRTGAL